MLENLKTVILLGVMTAILIILGNLIGSIFGLGMIGAIIGLLLGIVMNFVSYFYSDSITLKAYNARIVSEDEAPNLHYIVADLAQKAGIKKPRVAIVPSDDPNAFATGRNEDHAVVAATTGILNILDEDELRGVLGHELGHIKNRDILISSVSAILAGMIVTLADIGSWVIFFADENDESGNVIATIILSLLAPIAATLIQLTISRAREYKADATGAQISGNPLALARALEKLEYGVSQNPMSEAKPTDAHMFIINPFGHATAKIQQLFSTHPSTQERIKRLQEMSSNGSYLQS